MPHPRLLFLVPLEIEAAAVRRALAHRPNAAVLRIGPRAASMPPPHALPQADWVVVAGIAGALDPALATADVIAHGLPQTHAPGPPTRRGLIHTADAIATTPAHKAELRRLTHADAVDMEHALVVERLSHTLGPSAPPVIGLRAIADTAADTLPPFMADLVDDRGRSRLGAAIGLALLRPARIPALISAGRQASAACRGLAAAALDLATTLRTP